MHCDLLCSQSAFFAAALHGQFAEGISQTINLPDVEPKYFEHVVVWFYQQRLDDDKFFFKDGKPTYFTLLDLYSLADRLSIEGMRNAIVDRIAILAELTNSVPTPSDTYILYETIRENSPVRELILDLFAFKKTDNLLEKHPDQWHTMFLRELVVKLKKPQHWSLDRHDLRPWRCNDWTHTKACEVCRTVLKPTVNGSICVLCEKAFCGECVAAGRGGGQLDFTIAERDCKPWMRGICAYHEHLDTDACPRGKSAVQLIVEQQRGQDPRDVVRKFVHEIRTSR